MKILWLGATVSLSIVLTAASQLLAQPTTQWRAGLARVNITPPRPVVLLGYGDRTGPFERVVADIFAKALAGAQIS